MLQAVYAVVFLVFLKLDETLHLYLALLYLAYFIQNIDTFIIVFFTIFMYSKVGHTDASRQNYAVSLLFVGVNKTSVPVYS